MRFKIKLIKLLAAIVVASSLGAIAGCGTTRAYWGVHNEYEMGDPHSKHKKPKKPKKIKKHKEPKHRHYDD